MHELSLALNIIDIASEEAERRGGVGVNAVYLRLGPLAGVVKEALVSAFELARGDTPLCNSELLIEDVPLVVFCPTCQAERNLGSIQDFCCPDCGLPCGDVISGRELEIVALEIRQ